MMGTSITDLEESLNDFAPAVRTEALRKLASLAQAGAIPLQPETDRVNMHCHTFFSFNAYGHSPASLAWLGKQRGFQAMGIVDFDVLDGVDEFLGACDMVDVRGSAGIETRVFIPEYAAREINSPGEPGVCYHMGIGFTTGAVPDRVAPVLADLGWRAGQRNQELLARVNHYLNPVTIDYAHDVLPLAPGCHPTERHLVVAYLRAAERTVADPAAFWASKLGVEPGHMAALMRDPTALQGLMRARLMKRCGVGYIQPESGMFPSLEAFHDLIMACGALPCAAWLDGTSSVEQQTIEEWLQFLVRKNVAALNIIPDRNWNVADPGVRPYKVRNLYRVVELAEELDLPLNVGTEMNSFGQKLVDDFSTSELAPVCQAFLDGAFFIYGHTVMQRAQGLGYQSEWAKAYLPTRFQRNEFYTQVGHQVPPGKGGLARLRQLTPTMSPEDVMAKLSEPTSLPRITRI